MSLWDLADLLHPRNVGSASEASRPVFATNQLMATNDLVDDGPTRVRQSVQPWNVTKTGEIRKAATLGHDVSLPQDAYFSSEQGTGVTKERGGGLTVWDLTNPFSPHEIARTGASLDLVTAAAFLSHGGLLALADARGQVTIRTVQVPQEPLHTIHLPGRTGYIPSLAFEPGGASLIGIIADDTGGMQIVRWILDEDRASAIVCAEAHPKIAEGEWARYFPGVDYQPPC